MIITIIKISIIVVWVWIVYQVYTAPLFDEDEMPIKDKPKRIKRKFHVDINEDDINHDLGYTRRDDKEDVK